VPSRRVRSIASCICALILAGCTTASSEVASRSPSPTSSSVPTPTRSPSPPPPVHSKKHEFVRVDDIQGVSGSVAVATYENCVEKHHTTNCAGHLVESRDLGQSWDEITPQSLPEAVTLANPEFVDPDHGWVAAEDCAGGFARLYRTADGGETWRHVAVNSPTCNAGAGIFPIPVDPQVGYYVWSEPTASFMRLYRSSDGGATFGRTNELPVSGPFGEPPSFTSSTSGWLAGVIDGDAVAEHTTDAGVTWHGQGLPAPRCCAADVHAWAAPLFDGDVGAVPVLGHRHKIWHVQFDRSLNGGVTWSAGPAIELPGRYPPSVAMATSTVWWAASSEHDVVRTSDAGASWSTTSGPHGLTIDDVAPIDDARAWLLASGGEHTWLFLTVDGGRSWRRIRPEAPPFRQVVALPGTITGLAAGPNGTILARRLGHAGRQVVVMIDPATGRMTSSEPLPTAGLSHAEALAVFGGSVWYANQAAAGQRTSSILWRLDDQTLDVAARIHMPAPPTALASAAGGLWVGAGRALYLLDAAGRILRTVPIDGRVTHVAVDPAGTRLYVATDTPLDRSNHVVFEERSAWSGGVITSATDVGYADLGGPSSLAATDEGVWVSSPTGMMGTLQLFRASDLSPVGTVEDGQGVGFYEGSNAVSSTYAAGVLWITDYGTGLTCADPETGRVIERVLPRQDAYFETANVIAAAGGVFATNGREVVRIRSGLRCLTSP
jgi:photosystem II stability/assembly factor-like uncharacterized protein